VTGDGRNREVSDRSLGGLDEDVEKGCSSFSSTLVAALPTQAQPVEQPKCAATRRVNRQDNSVDTHCSRLWKRASNLELASSNWGAREWHGSHELSAESLT
jgi:hypothetical protein